MSQKIYIGKLSPTTTDKHLYDYFSQIGKVLSAKVIIGIDGKTNAGYGYVIMGSDKETQAAINKLNNTKFEGSYIKVVEAHPMDQENYHVFRRYINRRRRN